MSDTRGVCTAKRRLARVSTWFDGLTTAPPLRRKGCGAASLVNAATQTPTLSVGATVQLITRLHLLRRELTNRTYDGAETLARNAGDTQAPPLSVQKAATA